MGALVQVDERPPRRGLRARAVNRSGTHAVEARDGRIEVRALATWALERQFVHTDRGIGLALSDDATRVAVVVTQNDLQVHETRGGRVLWRAWVLCGFQQWDRALGRYTPHADERHVAISSDNRAALVRFDGRNRPAHPPCMYLCDLSDKQRPRMINDAHAVLFSPDGRWVPHPNGRGVELWNWREDRHSETMRPRDANIRMIKSGDRFVYHDPVRRRAPPLAACWPDKSYTHAPEAFATSYGAPVLAWTRRELLEVGPLHGPDYASIRDQRFAGARALAVDYTGELVAAARYRTLSVLDLPRRAVLSRATRLPIESLVFGPDGLLYGRLADNAVFAFRVDRP